MIVLSDTSPLNYLILIGHVDVLPALFSQVVIPSSVLAELQHPGTPAVVRQYINDPPAWLVVRTATRIDPGIHLGRGEAEAISLAVELKASLLLMDDGLGRRAAQERHLAVAGTLNVLEAAAERGLLDLPAAIAKLRLTNFHMSEQLLTQILVADAERKGRPKQIIFLYASAPLREISSESSFTAPSRVASTPAT